MITDNQYRDWLSRADASRVLLVELYHSNGVEYVANKPFISTPSDSLPNQPFNDLLSGVFDVTNRLDAQPAIGDIELVDDGKITHWADYLWRGYPVVLKLGDPSWQYDDFRTVANQLNAGVQTLRRGKLILGIYDSTAQLDKPINNRPEIDGQPFPLILGQVFGAPATQVSTTSLEYRVSWLPIQSLVVRDGNGPIVGHSSDYSNGQFTLNNYTPRSIACEVVEQHNTAQSIIQWVADQYNLLLAPLSLPNSQLGLRYEGDVTGRQILDDVCRAIGAHWAVNLAGKLDVKRLTLPVTADLSFTSDDIVRDQVSLIRTEEPWRSLKINYSKNHSPLSEVAGSINSSSPTLEKRLREEWLSVSQSQALPSYPLAPEQTLDTHLVKKGQVSTECSRRLALRSERREVWELEVFMVWSGDVVGKAVAINHPRLAGRLGRVISARLSPLQDRAVLEVWY